MTRKSVFILEDDPARIAYFVTRLARHDLTFADSCTQVDRFVPPYDFVFLDHDLGGRQMEEHEDNGSRFAQLVAPRINPQATIVIHTFNEDGGRNIRGHLMDHGSGAFIAPFFGAWFKSIVDRYL